MTEVMPTATPTPANIDFEATLAELETIVVQLEGEVKLEEALSLFERGMRLSHQCERFLQSAEQKIEVLKRAANGSLETTSYAPDPDA